MTDKFSPINLSNYRVAEDNVVDKFSKFISVFIDSNKVNSFRISHIKSAFTTKIPFEKGQTIEESHIHEIVRLVIHDKYYIKMRDDSCRFIDFGMDYIMYLCARHSDNVIQELDNCMINNVSDKLINTDIFDN